MKTLNYSEMAIDSVTTAIAEILRVEEDMSDYSKDQLYDILLLLEEEGVEGEVE